MSGAISDKKILNMDRNVFFAGVTSFLTDTTTKMLYVVMPMFLLSIGASKTELTLIEGIAESTASILKAFSGAICDRTGKNKTLMLIGYLATALVSPFYFFVRTPVDVLLLRFIERVGKGIRTSPRDRLIAVSAGADKSVGKYFGFHKTMDNCGAIVGPLLAWAMLSLLPGEYRIIFLISGIPACLGVLTILIFIHDVRQEKQVCSVRKRIHFKDFPPSYYFFLFIVFIFTLGNSTDALLLVKAIDIGYSQTAIPFLYLAFYSVSVLFSIPAGMLSDRFGRERMIIFGYLVYSGVYFGFGSTDSKGMILLLFMLYGFYSAATDGVQKALVSDLSSSSRKGTGLGIYNAILGMTLLPASILAGWMYDTYGSGVPFYFGGIMSGVAVLLMVGFYFIHKRKTAAAGL